MSELSPEAQRILDEAAAEDGPSAADRSRVKKGLIAALGASAFSSTAATTGTAAAAVAKTLSVAKAVKIALVAVLAGGAVAVTTQVVMREPAAESARVRKAPVAMRVEQVPLIVRAPVVPDAPIEAPVEIPAETAVAPVAAASVRHRHGHRHDAGTHGADRLRDEAQLLAKAQAALRRNAPAEALEAVRLHAAEFPQGALTEERLMLESLATCMLRPTGGERAARRFEREFPNSMFRARVRRACE